MGHRKNVTSKSDLLYAHRNIMALYGIDNLLVAMFDYRFHGYVNVSIFKRNNDTCGTNSSFVTKISKHPRPISLPVRSRLSLMWFTSTLCGHATYDGIRTPLKRNQHWSDAIVAYLTSTIDSCVHCRTVSLSKLSLNVSLANLNRQFNQRACVGHLFLGNITLATLWTLLLDTLQPLWSITHNSPILLLPSKLVV